MAKTENHGQSGQPALPENMRRLAEDETFHFRCHPEVPCFTECCRQLDLALTPYDVLRLAKNLGLSGADFLEQYVLIEHHEGEAFPRVYLGMVDDGRASCPFVSKAGCAVYHDRPGACRTYPLGRGAFLAADGSPREIHALLSEAHCRGFQENAVQTARSWQADQDLSPYNAMNDELLFLLQDKRLKDGWRPDGNEIELYLDTLYRLEQFKARALAGEITDLPLIGLEIQAAQGDDEAFLRAGIKWLHHAFFGT